ncbi:FtsW/RodA/SpoVE family cell cycle protein [bacterium]|nr:FtsW/RodA/SpoVE family cell cycle protein [bacterium]
MSWVNGNLARPILVLVMVLSLFGIDFLTSTAAGSTVTAPASSYVTVQLIAMILGFGAMFALSKIWDLDKMRRWSSWPAAVLCLFLTSVMLFCPEQNGARRWIPLGPFNIQVAEICKLLLICFWADVLARVFNRIGERQNDPSYERDYPGKRHLKPIFDAARRFWPVNALAEYLVKPIWDEIHLFVPAGILTFFVFFMLEKGHDLGMTVLIFLTIFAMCIATGLSRRLVCIAFITMSLVGTMLVIGAGYRSNRIVGWLNPSAHSQDIGYQNRQANIAFGSCGIVGRGLFKGIQKYFIPEEHTDFISATVGEETGLLCCPIFIIFLLPGWYGVWLSTRCKDPYRRLLALGISIQYVMQVLINFAVVLSLAPNKGLPLPFCSFGGSSICMTLASFGLLMNVAYTYRNYEADSGSTAKNTNVVCHAHTISSSMVPYPSKSSEVSTSPISSSEWRQAICADSVEQKRKLPEPRVKDGWDSKVISLSEQLRQRRERAKTIRENANAI